ncbi:hypothetical protein [Janibacter melonis]|uniref:hypothetical protein n=1 Tax=Janibacter melonis TaxID=262209 RepID=UPI00174AB3CD|nr:hypothetical protein [Janibacter melonis]
MSKTKALVVSLVVVLTLAVAGGALLTWRAFVAPSELEKVAEACDVVGLLEDGGKSITFDTLGKDESGIERGDIFDVGCVTNRLDTPSYVTTHIDNTRALDGQQTDKWDDYEARWSYHPDSGLDLTIIDRS